MKYTAYENRKRTDAFAAPEIGAGKYSGVEKKIRNFCEVLGEACSIALDILPPFEQDASRMKRVLRRWLPWTPVGHFWQYHGQYDDAEFLYIRKAEHDASFISFLRDVKKCNSNIKILDPITKSGELRED